LKVPCGARLLTAVWGQGPRWLCNACAMRGLLKVLCGGRARSRCATRMWRGDGALEGAVRGRARGGGAKRVRCGVLGALNCSPPLPQKGAPGPVLPPPPLTGGRRPAGMATGTTWRAGCRSKPPTSAPAITKPRAFIGVGWGTDNSGMDGESNGRQMDWSIDRWIEGWLAGWMHACMHACMHAWTDRWMDGWMPGVFLVWVGARDPGLSGPGIAGYAFHVGLLTMLLPGVF
jgi:hypothetical protein